MTGHSYIITTQLVWVLLATIVGYLWDPEVLRQTISIAYGGGLTILASLVLAWRIGRITRLSSGQEDKAMMLLYLGAFERLIIAVAGFALGVLKLDLTILPMVVGFIAGQLGFLIGGIKSRI